MDLNKVQPILELYGPVVQSEGSKTGIPHLVLRTTGCSHRCFFGEGGWCDTWYTSIHPEKGKYTLSDFQDLMDKHPECNHLMLTGGSPTMHGALCNDVINLFKEYHIDNGGGIVTIETEGSHYIETDQQIDLISLSPKFSNSIPVLGSTTPGGKVVDEKFIKQHNKFRLNKDAMEKMIYNNKDYHFKPVINPIKQPEVWKEILEFMEEMDIPKNKTWIMPPGDSKEAILEALADVITFCGENCYNFSGRDHILAFGDKKCV